MSASEIKSTPAPYPDDRRSFWLNIYELDTDTLRKTEEWNRLDPFDRGMLLDGYSPGEIEELRRVIE